MIDGDANMTIGSYDPSLERVRIMSFTRSYMQHAFVFAYEKSRQLSSPLARLMAPFQDSVWISIAFILSASTLIILLLKKLSTKQRHFVIGGYINRTPIMNMLNILIGNGISNSKMKQTQYFGCFARTLLIFWLFFWLIVRNSYQGSLYQFLQSQLVQSPYDTVEKVRESTVKINVIRTAAGLIPDYFQDERLDIFWLNYSQIEEFDE